MFQINLEPKRIAAVDFIGLVRYELKKAIAESEMGLGDVAKTIGVTRARLLSELDGSQEITVGRIAEICWAIGRAVEINIVESKMGESK